MGWYNKARKNVLFAPISHIRGGQERKDSIFFTQFTGGDKGTFVLEASLNDLGCYKPLGHQTSPGYQRMAWQTVS